MKDSEVYETIYNQQLEKSQRPVGLFENKDEYIPQKKGELPTT